MVESSEPKFINRENAFQKVTQLKESDSHIFKKKTFMDESDNQNTSRE